MKTFFQTRLSRGAFLVGFLPAIACVQSQAAQTAAPPEKPKATAAAAPAPAAPAPKPMDAKTEALARWFVDYFAWGAGDLAVEDVAGVKIPGYRFVKVSKTFDVDARANDQTYAALDDEGKYAIAGDVFGSDVRFKEPKAPMADSDLAVFVDPLEKYFGNRSFKLVLDAANDKRGWKAVRVLPDAGYGRYEIPGYVSGHNGAILVLGRAWDRGRSFTEQRKELLRIDDRPTYGPADAKITVVEFSDMQCGFCKKRTADWDPLAAKLPNLKFKKVQKFFPLVSNHPWAFRAASAGLCFFGKEPELFARWKSNVYKQQDTLSVAAVDTFALDFALANDIPREVFSACYLQQKGNQKILADMTEGFTLRVRSTPTYFIDGVMVNWFADDLMEEFLRKTYMGGQGLPLKSTAAPAPKK